MKNDEQRVERLTTALQNAEQKLAEREVLITTVMGQTETARSQYDQATERAETLRRRLDAKEEQLNTLQSKLDAASADVTAARETVAARDQRISALQQELQKRDERIAILEQLYAENDNALNAINQDVKRQNLEKPSERLAAMGLVLESLDEPGVHHKISRVTTTLGRVTGNDIAINSSSVSRYHSRIVIESDGAYLTDLQSTNGCSVNGRRISRQLIGDGDVISIGTARFRLTIGAPMAQTEDRSMDETRAPLDDAAIVNAAPGQNLKSAHKPTIPPKAKTKQ
jgi:pSer/pThr/pTyr-binding forkhead associated (FHA) protein